jgi:hypothetical protein
MNKFLLRLLLMTALMLPSLGAISQAVPPVTTPSSGAIFVQGSVTRLESNVSETQYGNLLCGGEVGAYFQFRPWLGIDARGLVLESRTQVGHEERQRAGFSGLRFSFSRRRLKTYGIALGGISHAEYETSPTIQYSNGQDVLTAATEPAFRAGGGIDLQLTRRMFWRMGEVTYGHVFVHVPAGVVGPNGPTGTNFSTGLVLKILR